LKKLEMLWSTRPATGVRQSLSGLGKVYQMWSLLVFCPDASIRQRDDGFYEADLDYCKGCGICARECKPGAISMVEEER
jgi:Pyruvate/2-oxoacid:ferredoxin oxidoreductase delta subunit